ncbi:hypothetical protein A1O1_07771 [Capronia coronata CBS 617.96]|uniref:Calcineurin-like phosphoesterase domain-containing protein n=1 Tax=Capronia coronata CBS 617.96 TaxID=1182541 RepID=W9XXJ8_9EURO|nr:uncharacterized protein A1O1_07771 [Capronia coronata CBS 617.96]EXJ81706.1 hypothetical protein A1O1_07771 [Capronia coronata CBS 617.96]
MTTTPIKTRILILSDTHAALPQGYQPETQVDPDPSFDPVAQTRRDHQSPQQQSNKNEEAETLPFSHPLPRADVLLHCGDLTMNGSIEQHARALRLIKSVDADLKIVIPGNHDITLDRPYYENHPTLHASWAKYSPETLDMIRDMYVGQEARSAGIRYLEEGVGEYVLENGARLGVYASAYQPEFWCWAFGYEREVDRYNPTKRTGVEEGKEEESTKLKTKTKDDYDSGSGSGSSADQDEKPKNPVPDFNPDYYNYNHTTEYRRDAERDRIGSRRGGDSDAEELAGRSRREDRDGHVDWRKSKGQDEPGQNEDGHIRTEAAVTVTSTATDSTDIDKHDMNREDEDEDENEDEDEEGKRKRIGIDIMLTHGPPQGILDYTSTGQHVGCDHLRKAVQRCRPQVHCFGHIHEARGAVRKRWHVEDDNVSETSVTPSSELAQTQTETQTQTQTETQTQTQANCRHSYIDAVDLQSKFGQETLFVNASIMDLQYKPSHAPWVVDLMLPPAASSTTTTTTTTES